MIVVGAGLVGLCCALSLLEHGRAVTLLDPNAPGSGASYGNAGIISPYSIVPQSMPGLWRHLPGWLLRPDGPLRIPLAHLPRIAPWGLSLLRQGTEPRVREVSRAMSTLCAPSIELYRQHLRGTGRDGLVRDALYVHAFARAADADPDELGHRLRREAGARVERVSGDELREIEPALSPRYAAAILIHGQARALSPGGIARALAAKALGMGAVHERAEARALRREDGGWRIETDRGPRRAREVVLAANVRSADLLRPLGLRVPLAAERGYHVEFEGAAALLENSVMDVDAKAVASSMEGGLRLAGTSELAPADAPPTPSRSRLLERQARAMVPALADAPPPRTWMGVRPSFPDSLPALGPIEGLPGLHAAFGHSHYGLMMAPQSGRIVAGAIVGARPNADLAPFAPTRFGRSSRGG